jgi:hypothetical protein
VKLLILFLSLCSCAGLVPQASPKQEKRIFGYHDVSGKWALSREHKIIKKKLVSRVVIAQNLGTTGKHLEKSVVVSQVGTIQGKRGRIPTVRPFAVEYSVWLEGKEYKSQMKLDPAKKSMTVDLDSPEARWKGRSSIRFPKGDQFCFFSQLAECLHFNQLLYRAQAQAEKPIPFLIVWDSFPYVKELYSGVGGTLFASAAISFAKESQGVLHFEVEVDGQTLLYQFSKSHELVRMFWISQGISILPPGEEVQEVE